MQWPACSHPEWRRTPMRLFFRIDGSRIWWEGFPLENPKARQGAGFDHGWKIIRARRS